MSVYVQVPGRPSATLPLEPRSALAAQLFPDEWARLSRQRGPSASKMRQQLRRKAAEMTGPECWNPCRG